MTETPSSSPAPRPGVRRTTRRSVLWVTPVVLATVTAPAFAASPPLPLKVTATNEGTGGSNKLLLTFTTGVGPLTLTQVTRNGTVIAMNPTSGISAAGGTSEGTGQSYVAGASYLVSYVYQGTPFTQSVVAT